MHGRFIRERCLYMPGHSGFREWHLWLRARSGAEGWPLFNNNTAGGGRYGNTAAERDDDTSTEDLWGQREA
jgi:hypothetical protein